MDRAEGEPGENLSGGAIPGAAGLVAVERTDAANQRVGKRDGVIANSWATQTLLICQAPAMTAALWCSALNCASSRSFSSATLARLSSLTTS